MKHLPKISEAEYEVMKIIWKKAPISTNEVTELLLKYTAWNPKTIHTLIKRLVQKGALTYEKDSRVFVYSPAIKEEDYLYQESDSFLKRFYNGNLSSMLLNFIEREELSEEERNELKNILDHQEDC